MTTITITGTHKDPDGTFPDNTVVQATLMTAYMFSGGAFINRHRISTAIDNGDGTFSLTLHVPDDADQAALYYFVPPDGKTFRSSVSQGSATDWETFIANATTEDTYEADNLAGYMTKSAYDPQSIADDAFDLAVHTGTVPNGSISEGSVTQHEAAIDHDALTNFVADEHIDWTATGSEDDFIITQKTIPGYVPKPDDFNWQPPFGVWMTPGGTFRTNFVIERYGPQSGVKAYYVDLVAGDDGNGGTDPETDALKSVDVALANSDLDILFIAPGIYSYGNGWDNYRLQRDAIILPYPNRIGEVVLSVHDSGLSWSVNGTYANVYEATRGTVITNAVDASILNEYGNYSQLAGQASISDVNDNAGSWYDDGSKIYVRTSDDRSPDSDVRCYLGLSTNARISSEVTVYVEGITFHGGTTGLYIDQKAGPLTPTVYMSRCAFKYCPQDGVGIYGAYAYFLNCETSQNKGDGFNWDDAFTGSHGAEIDCVGFANGADQTGSTYNGSTSHQGSFIVRVNGFYHNNRGPNVAEASGSQSWNVGVVSHDSTGISVQNTNFQCDGSGSEMWLDRCYARDSTYSLRATVSGLIYRRNQIYSIGTEEGTISNY